IQVDTAVVCTVCGGNGAAPGTLPQTCDKCEGRGEVTQVVKSFLGETPTQRPCQQCSGFGTVLPTPCFECTGDGRVRARRTLTLRIPAGVNNADRLQFAGEGEVGPGGGPPADLYVEVRESAHPVFQRQADDLHCTLTVPMTTAILGATIPLETFDGIRNISVPPGAQTGELIRLRNLGVTQQGGKSRGELVIQIQVTTPTRVDVEQEQLIRQFAALRGEERTNHQGRFSRPPDTLNGP
ncbi:MAG TPA: DnaJ C-terminal domain-containing protein, partial [Streptomyces sp.]|uniref:DnaJ C-terminal domain-containing protein n=1 Tax=Streptomyces sp. TaxID=1931 RepID=UPI002B9DFFB8